MRQLIMILVVMVAAFALPTMAQNNNAQHPAFGTTAPSANFRSTSGAYMATGSAYSTTVHEVGSNSPAASPSGPRRSGFNDITVDDGSGTQEAESDPTNTQFSPLGDAVLPLLLMSLAFAGVIYLRKRRVVK